MSIPSLLALVLPLLLAVAPVHTPRVHPHHPKALVVGGAGGKITVTYLTVPFNADHLRSLKPDQQWHLGFAGFATEVPLRAGDTAIPAGSYRLGARYGADEKWSFVLEDARLRQVRRELRELRGPSGDAEAAKRIAELEAQEKELGEGIALAAADFTAEHAEHLGMAVLQHGYATVARGSTEPAGGAAFALRVSFGDLHRSVELAEVFPVASDK